MKNISDAEFIQQLKDMRKAIVDLQCKECKGKGWHWFGWHRQRCETCKGTGVKYK